MRSKWILGAVVASALGVTSANAATYYSWENSLEGWTDPDGSTSFSTTTGVTEGSTSLVVDPAVAGYWALQRQNWVDNADFQALNDAQKLNTHISIDITVTQPIPEGASLGVSIGIFNSGYAHLGTFAEQGLIADGQPHTYTFDYAAAGWGGPSVDWGMVYIAINEFNYGATTPAPLYIDNFQLVPEPASLSVLGLGAMGLLARRRRA